MLHAFSLEIKEVKIKYFVIIFVIIQFNKFHIITCRSIDEQHIYVSPDKIFILKN